MGKIYKYIFPNIFVVPGAGLIPTETFNLLVTIYLYFLYFFPWLLKLTLECNNIIPCAGTICIKNSTLQGVVTSHRFTCGKLTF